jgi:hypothetical protein
MSLARMFLSARENAQRCAVDCVPYVHAKLHAVHHEHGPTGRYIIADNPYRMPVALSDRVPFCPMLLNRAFCSSLSDA